MSLRFFISNTLLMAFFIFLIGFGWWCITDDGNWIMSIPDEQVSTIMGAFSEVIIEAVIMLIGGIGFVLEIFYIKFALLKNAK